MGKFTTAVLVYFSRLFLIFFSLYLPAPSAQPVGGQDFYIAPELQVAARFRQNFFSFLQTLPVEDFDKLIYFPATGMFDETSASQITVENCSAINLELKPAAFYPLCQLSQTYLNQSQAELQPNWSTRSLYQRGRDFSEKMAPLTLDAKRLEQIREEDWLIVVVPGIFGEFIDKWAFDEVLRLPSHFKSEFIERYQALSRAKGDDQALFDSQALLKYYGAKDLVGERQVPLTDLFQLGSLKMGALNKGDGNSWASVALFNLAGMSLESLGDSAANAEIFNRRLGKLFQVLGRTPPNILFVGYSRGTNFALDMLSQAQRENLPWLQNVRALVSLGGVTFGSALADQVILDKESKGYHQLEALKLLANSLSLLDNSPTARYQNARYLALNTLLWFAFIKRMAALESPDLAQKLKQLERDTNTAEQVKLVIAWFRQSAASQMSADPSAGVKMALQHAHNFGFIAEEDLIQQLLDHELNLLDLQSVETLLTKVFQRDFSEKYNSDILRFQKFVKAVDVGVEQLSTNSRLKWWSTFTVPQSVRYYTLAGAMDSKDSDLVNNRIGYNPGSLDDNLLTQNWSEFAQVGISALYQGNTLNDSQMSIFKTHFWPSLIETLKPKNKLTAIPLGILGTHHWGFALPIVNKVRNTGTVLEANPFPRAALLKAITLTVGEDVRLSKKEQDHVQ